MLTSLNLALSYNLPIIAYIGPINGDIGTDVGDSDICLNRMYYIRRVAFHSHFAPS
jgi:hypothetical protein